MNKCHFTRPAHSLKIHKLIHKIFTGSLLCTRLSARTEVLMVHKLKCLYLQGDSTLSERDRNGNTLRMKSVA